MRATPRHRRNTAGQRKQTTAPRIATADAFAALEALSRTGYDMITPSSFAASHGAAASEAAFAMAVEAGLIELSYIGMTGAPVCRPAGVSSAIAEAQRIHVRH